MNHFYLEHRALWEEDFTCSGFEWVDCEDKDNCVISYLRKSASSTLLVVHNFSPNPHCFYRITLPHLHSIEEVFNTDREEYFGSGKLNHTILLQEPQVELTLAPLATSIFEVHFVS